MAHISQDVRESIWRFRDAIIGVGVSLVGLYLAIGGVGFMSILGTSVALAGALLVFAGIQRGRFRTGDDGPGVVHVDEGQITYYGPISGGSLTVEEIARIELEPDPKIGLQWLLFGNDTPSEDEALHIPTDAAGAETLFDVFSALDGMDMEALLAKLNGGARERSVVWQSRAGKPALT